MVIVVWKSKQLTDWGENSLVHPNSQKYLSVVSSVNYLRQRTIVRYEEENKSHCFATFLNSHFCSFPAQIALTICVLHVYVAASDDPEDELQWNTAYPA